MCVKLGGDNFETAHNAGDSGAALPGAILTGRMISCICGTCTSYSIEPNYWSFQSLQHYRRNRIL